MRRAIISVVVVSAVALVAGSVPAYAVPRFGSCASLKKEFPDGVAKSSAAASAAVKKGFARPVVDRAVYNANVKLGHGGGGFICASRATAKPSPSATPTPTESAAPAARSVTVTVVSTDAKYTYPSDPYSIDDVSAACAKNPTSTKNLWQNGTQIVAKDETGALISTGQLDAGAASNKHQYVNGGRYFWDCTWTASLVLPRAKYYTIQVGGEDTSDAISYEDLIKYNYTVSLKFPATYPPAYDRPRTRWQGPGVLASDATPVLYRR